MSSHREAPAISTDPVADNTDTYAFVSSDEPDTVTIIASYLPLEAPFGGPNFFEFGDDVRYEIHIDRQRRRPAARGLLRRESKSERPDGGQVGDRRVDRRQPTPRADPGDRHRPTTRAAIGCRCRASATRCSTR